LLASGWLIFFSKTSYILYWFITISDSRTKQLYVVFVFPFFCRSFDGPWDGHTWFTAEFSPCSVFFSLGILLDVSFSASLLKRRLRRCLCYLSYIYFRMSSKPFCSFSFFVFPFASLSLLCHSSSICLHSLFLAFLFCWLKSSTILLFLYCEYMLYQLVAIVPEEQAYTPATASFCYGKAHSTEKRHWHINT
jgi:hypothetical protein